MTIGYYTPPTRTTASRYSSPDGFPSINDNALEVTLVTCIHVWHGREWWKCWLWLLLMCSRASGNSVAAWHSGGVAEEARVGVKLDASETTQEVCDRAPGQLDQTYVSPIFESPEVTILEPLCAREMRCIHVNAPGNNRSLRQGDPAMYEDRCEQTPYVLLLPSRRLERLHLQLDQMLNKQASEVGPVVVCGLADILHVD